VRFVRAIDEGTRKKKKKMAQNTQSSWVNGVEEGEGV
jgi:hypothetical protein